jgi:uncharacterized protein YcfJ
MRKDIIMTALIAAGASLPAVAADEYFDQARVLSVTPQYERVNHPVETCSTEYVRESVSSRDSSPVGAIIGGVAGGLLGSQIGKGNGRVAGAAVGAGIGAIVGDRLGSSRTVTYQSRPVERCVMTDNWQTVTTGYLVTYRYNGRDYTTVLDHDPGRTLPVRVSVSPGHEVSSIGYYRHGFTVPTRVMSGHAVAAQPYVMNIQFHGEKGGKNGPDKHHRRDAGKRYY